MGAIDAENVQVPGTVNTNGVTDAGALPLTLGDITAGCSTTFTLLYMVPMGVGSYSSTVYLTAGNSAGIMYEYPGAFPGA